MELRIPMQPPTGRPWSWPGWDARSDLLDRYQRRRFRLTLHDLAELRNMHDARLNVDWNHPRQEIAVYVPKNLRHLIRLDQSDPGRSPGLGYQAGSWPPPPPPTSRSAKGFSLFGSDDWKLPDLKHLRLETIPMSGSGMELPRGFRSHWEGVARAWAGGALLLLAVVLLLRAVEKCVQRNFFKSRRRQSEEWPTPNVFATALNRRLNELELSTGPRMDDSDVFPSEGNQDSISNDLPPPYSECANAADDPDANKYVGPEEPPPPYSACYVAYSNPKDGVPSVHFLNRQRQNIFRDRNDAGHSSRMPDVNLQNADNTAKAESDDCDNPKTEFVFENGRVIAREGSHVNSGSNTRDDRDDECVVNISEPGVSGVPDSSSLHV